MQFADPADVAAVSTALQRLGMVGAYAAIVEPVRGWYYVHFVRRETDNHKRPRGVRLAKTYVVEHEFGPLRGPALRGLANTSARELALQRKRGPVNPPSRNRLRPMNWMVRLGDAGLDLRNHQAGAAWLVKRNSGVETWHVASTNNVRQWPDTAGLIGIT